jgi:hypothetical protein
VRAQQCALELSYLYHSGRVARVAHGLQALILQVCLLNVDKLCQLMRWWPMELKRTPAHSACQSGANQATIPLLRLQSWGSCQRAHATRAKAQGYITVSPAGSHCADTSTECAQLNGAAAGSVPLALPGGAAPAAHSFGCFLTRNDAMMVRCDSESRSIRAHVLKIWLHAVQKSISNIALCAHAGARDHTVVKEKILRVMREHASYMSKDRTGAVADCPSLIIRHCLNWRVANAWPCLVVCVTGVFAEKHA